VTVRVASEAGRATAALAATPGVKARSALISLYRFMAVRPSRPERKDMSLIRRDKKFAVRDRRLHAQTHSNPSISVALSFVRFEPYVLPKRSLTGDTAERVDTRVWRRVTIPVS
jgi:hypothetical protein